MRRISVKDIAPADIGKVIKVTLPNPVLSGYKNGNTVLTVTGILQGYVKVQAGGDLILEIGTSRHIVSEIYQEVLFVSFPLEEE